MSTHTTHRCRNCGAPAMPGGPLCAACAATQALAGNEPDALPYEAVEALSDDMAAIIAAQIERIREKSETIARLQKRITRLQNENDLLSDQLTAAANAHVAERAYSKHLEQQLEGLRDQLAAITGQSPVHTQNGGLLHTIRRLFRAAGAFHSPLGLLAAATRVLEPYRLI